MADGRIGQNRFEIIFENGHFRAVNHSDQAHTGHRVKPRLGARQHRPQPRHQKQPRFHHGGRMQIGRNRRGRGHGMGQPKMKRHLRRFGECAQQNKSQHRQIQRARLNHIGLGQNNRKVIAARHLPQHDKPRKQRKPPRPCNGQRHTRTAPRLRIMPPISNQQERRQRCHFPKQQHQQHVIRNNDAQHRALKK